MANLWNKRNLPLPLRRECRIDDRNLDLKLNRNILREAIQSLQHSHLQAEAALLSRIIYRMKTKFRNDKGLKELQKINISLRRYLTLDLPRVLDRFLSSLPARKLKKTQYPTLGNLDYLLTRLQGTAKLLSRTAECAKYSAHFMQERISIGHFWNVTCISLGMTARVFVLVKNAVKTFCKLYNNLMGLRFFLKGVSGYENEDNKLPEDLRKWLDDDWIFDEDISEDIDKKLSKLKKKKDVEFCDEYIEIDDDVDLIDEYIDISNKRKEIIKHDTSIKIESNSSIDKIANETLEENDEVNSSILIENNKEEAVPEIIESDEDIGEVVPEMEIKRVKKLKRKNISGDNIPKKKVKLEKVEKSALTCKKGSVPKVIESDENIEEVVPEIEIKRVKKLKRKNISSDDNIPKKKMKSEKAALKFKNGKKQKLIASETNGNENSMFSDNLKLAENKEKSKKLISNVNKTKVSENQGDITKKKKLKKIKNSKNLHEDQKNATGKIELQNDLNGNEKDYNIEKNITKKDPNNKGKKSFSKALTNKNETTVTNSQKLSPSPCNVIKSINSISELTQFVKRENKFRDINLKKCRFKHLDKMQWNMLSKLMKGIVSKSAKNAGKTDVFLNEGKNALLMNLQ